MRKCCRQSQAELGCNNRNKVRQTWGPPFSQSLYMNPSNGGRHLYMPLRRETKRDVYVAGGTLPSFHDFLGVSSTFSSSAKVALIEVITCDHGGASVMNCYQHCQVPKRWNQSPKHRVLGGFLTDMADRYMVVKTSPCGIRQPFCQNWVKIIC